jgi:hypothetical protein
VTAGIEVDAGLALQLGRLSDQLAQHSAQLAAFQDAPTYIPFAQAGIIPASGSLIIDVSGPNLGYQWMVRRIAISDAGTFSATMGSAVAQFYVGLQTELAAVRPNHVAWPFTVVPNVATFGSDELPVLYGEHLLCLVTGGTAGQTVMASAMVQLFKPQSVIRQQNV